MLNGAMILWTLAIIANKSAIAMPDPQDANQPAKQDQISKSPVSPSAASEGKATIYVYRKGSMVGSAGHALIFVNDVALAQLHRDNYASLEAPAGAAVLSASNPTEDYNIALLRQSLPPRFKWPKCTGDTKKPNCDWDAGAQASGPQGYGCAKLNWQRLDEASKGDIKVCASELNRTAAALDNWLDPHRKTKELALSLLLPTAMGSGLAGDAIAGPHGDQSAWLQMCGPEPFGEPSAEAANKVKSDLKRGDVSDNWSRCRNGVAAAWLIAEAPTRLRIDVESGKSYYVEWSISKMTLVDSAKGADEIRGLHLANQR
jgi:hypothetical protein